MVICYRSLSFAYCKEKLKERLMESVAGKRKFVIDSVTALMLFFLAACGNSAPTLNEVQNELEMAYNNVEDWTGIQVDSLEAVNERVTASTKEIVGLFGELDYKMAFRENGIAFANASGVEGVVGIQGNSLVLDVAFPGDNAEAAHTVTRILTIFSDNNWTEDRLTAITNGNEPQTVQLENGWIETDGKIVNVHLEKALI